MFFDAALVPDDHVRSFMDHLTQHYLRYQSFFPKRPYSWVVCTVFGNSVALSSQQNPASRTLRL